MCVFTVTEIFETVVHILQFRICIGLFLSMGCDLKKSCILIIMVLLDRLEVHNYERRLQLKHEC